MSIKKPKIIVVLGPTATGKSVLAVRLAKKFSSKGGSAFGGNGEVISADSRQVYRGVDLGSDKVPRDNSKFKSQSAKLQFKIKNWNGKEYLYEGIRHHLIDVANPKRKFTVTQYKKLAEKAIKDILKRGNPPKFRGTKFNRARIPILCGGTGLYIDALINDWKLPEVKPNLKLRRELDKKSTEELFLQLKKLDPKRAGNIDPRNKRRLVRALEIVTQTSKSSYSNVLENNRILKYDVLKIGLRVAPEELKKRIKKRTLKRLREGVAKEMESLKRSGVSQKRLNDISLYYRWLQPYLKGEMNQAEALEIISTKIGQYAKRQMTWFKRDKNIHWITKNSEMEKLVRNFLK